MVYGFLEHSRTKSDEKISGLYFTHDRLITKMLAYLGLYETNFTFTEKDGRLCIPENRAFRITYHLPFNVNLAHILYRCPKEKYKILNLHNENPIIVRGCSSAFCDLDTFAKIYEPTLKDCRLETICSEWRTLAFNIDDQNKHSKFDYVYRTSW